MLTLPISPSGWIHPLALIIELKAGGTPEEALEQIRSRNYPASVDGLGAHVVLVTITYGKDDKAKPHYCRIEQM